ncbi:alkene reductase [Paraburkholderia pallida]|uniref:Alkene reductase n=1 Tax=Paraburkholderia pallida TaxID=2547399 RepID=A0A4V1B0W0_9BURK|nr:alkene reductase [Paraburkholderia pallida]QBR04143.1 alkene reductase [Paraburkholderia pallida]
MTQPDQAPLFSPYALGELQLGNRVVMASMTRGRASNAALAPTELHVEYYRQRAAAGLIFTEGTWISQRAVGFINAPGLFTERQVEGWRAVTSAVHVEGGKIFAQLAHSGAVSHPDFFNGALPVAPSAVNPGLKAFTPGGFKDTVTPRAMSLEEIASTVADYGAAAKNAREAGFDGVELHAATTYLLPEFLNSALNTRDDAYGGTAENRTRIVLEVIDALIAVWGPGRVGIKISPTLAMGGFGPTDETIETYDCLVGRLNELPVSHLQVGRALNDLSGTPVAALQDTIGYYRARFNGTLIANFGFDGASANLAVASDQADLVSFAKPFIGNPDLVRRLREGLPLAESFQETYYQGGPQGYVDYPAAP